jgi:hypothetical protein
MAYSDETFFSQARSINTLYCDKEGDNLSDVRLCLARFGEDVELVLAKFWEEVPSSNFTVVPIFSHGLPPRRALSTPRSILAALETITPEPGSAMEQRWKELCRDLGVAYPKHLQQVA